MIGWYAHTRLSILLVFILTLGLADFGYRIYQLKKLDSQRTMQLEAIGSQMETTNSSIIENLPIGVIAYNEEYEILWLNRFGRDIFGAGLYNEELKKIDLEIYTNVINRTQTFEYHIKDTIYRISHLPKKRLMYLTDITMYKELDQKYEDGKPVVGSLVMDNYEEAVRDLKEHEKNELRGKMVSIIMQWAEENHILVKTTRSDHRYVLVLSNKILNDLREKKFTILDEVRNAAKEREMTFTISIGLASGYGDFGELGTRADLMLDLALSRGGDQVVIKIENDEKILFYGGKTNPIAKPSRVRSRMNAQAYEKLIKESDQVIIMGHRYPDVDAIGASIGLLRMSLLLNKEAYIVLNPDELDHTNQIFVDEILKNENLAEYFIHQDQALKKITENTLLVVADTQDPRLVIMPELLTHTEKIAVFDHHRRGANYIEAVLSYIEASASSTVELVVEMFDYFSQGIRISPFEASIMLAGIIVDTRRFSYHTGRRTYEAAALLKEKGADENLVQQLLRTPIINYYNRAHLIERIEIFKDSFLIAAADDFLMMEKVQLAQAADELLNIQDVKATFVLGRISGNSIGISARSLGDVNVQVLMEKLGGGGHLNNAATQLEATDIKEVISKLKKMIEGESD